MQTAEPEVPGERCRLVADPLHEVAVAADHERVVVDQVRAEAGAQHPLGDAEADAVGEALAERTGSHLDAGELLHLGVARGPAAELAELLEIVELEPVPGQVEHRVQQDAGVAAREHEPVPVRPVRIARVVVHDPRPQDVGQGREGHGGTGMTGVGLLGCVHRQPADDVDAKLFEVAIAHERYPIEAIALLIPNSYTGGSRVRGTTVAGPSGSRRQCASMVPSCVNSSSPRTRR